MSCAQIFTNIKQYLSRQREWDKCTSDDGEIQVRFSALLAINMTTSTYRVFALSTWMRNYKEKLTLDIAGRP